MDMEDPKLIQSYVRDKYFVSTALRYSTTTPPVKYFETFAWEYDSKANKRGKFIEEDATHSSSPYQALEQHIELCTRLAERHDPPMVSHPYKQLEISTDKER